MTPRVLAILGALMMLAAVADRLRARLTQPEKDAVFAFGHWFEVGWEAPC